MTSTTEPGWTTHARRLADLLRERGDIRSPQWHAAIAEVPRDVFVPCAYEQDDTGQWRAWDTAGSSERVYAPKTLVTALADRGGHLGTGLVEREPRVDGADAGNPRHPGRSPRPGNRHRHRL